MYASCPYVYKWSRKIRPADTPDVEPKHRQLLIVHQAGLNSSSTTVRQGQEEDRELRGVSLRSHRARVRRESAKGLKPLLCQPLLP